jgi:hypothetical protein
MVAVRPQKLQLRMPSAHCVFDRLAARHASYMAKITARAEEKFRPRLKNRPWPADPAEFQALREACGLPQRVA